jgi:hypothetical protein
MAIWKRIRESLDWLAHGKLLFEIAVAIGGAKLLKAIVMQLHRVPHTWLSPIEWLSGALILFLMMRFVSFRRGEVSSSKLQISTVVEPLLAANNPVHSLPPNFDVDEFFRIAYVSQLSREVETNMRFVAHQKSPNDVEAFYLRFIGVGLVQAIHDSVWWPMYKSQLGALLEVNRNGGIVPIANVKQYYDGAAEQYPKEYQKDSFERWLSYLTSNQLVIRHPSDMAEITVNGKDFLKFLTHWGREPNGKRL